MATTNSASRSDTSTSSPISPTTAESINTASLSAAFLFGTNETQLRRLLDALTVGIWVIDAHGYTTFVNQQMTRLLGYNFTEMSGKHLFDFMDSQGVELCEINLARRAQGIAEEHEFEFLRKDGARIYTSLSTSPLSDDEGQYAGAVAAVRDTTEQKKMREQLVTESCRLESLSQNIGVGLATIGRDFRVRWMNEVLKGVFGNRVGELCYCAFNQQSSVCPTCGVFEIFEKGGAKVEHEQVGKDKEGRTVWSQIIATPIYDSSGKVSEVLEAVVPITARKLMEEELARSRTSYQLLSQNLQIVTERERAQIARDIHDILGNELTAVSWDLHWIDGKLPPAPNEVREHFDRIKASLEAVSVSAKNLVTGIRPGVLDHLGLFAALEWQIRDFSRRSGVTCQTKGLVGDPKFTSEQSTMVFRVFQEALSNIAKHSRATEVSVEISAVDGELNLEISDNGVGIDPKALAAVDSFGLIGMRERVKFIGGCITIERAPKGGTTVRIQVPL